jgi:cell division protein FtsI/penicillin-binding protein 2
VSFAGFFPANQPRLMGLVIVDDAKRSSEQNYGGLVAAPVFSKIGEEAARYLDLPTETNPAVALGGLQETASDTPSIP